MTLFLPSAIHLTMNIDNQKLSVLRDDPLFRTDTFAPGQDAFNHQAYAKAIFKVITETDPPLSIGLFGPWGIGKSTVINILFQLARDTATLKPVYFNAWKYSGDSFRRQFLIEVAKQIYDGHPERDQKVQRVEQLNYTEVLREDEKKSLLAQVKQILSLQMRFKEAGLARILLASVVLLVGAALTIADHSAYPLLAAVIPAALFFFLKLKFEDVFLVKENPVYDPKLIFPEQFEAEFRKLLDPRGPLGDRNVIIAVDDIDRCEPETVRDILISIKTFLGQESCFFVVPCDEMSIVQVFQDANQKKGYETELLRKYFNVGVRMTPIMGTDLVDLANNISREWNIAPSVVQVAILANYRDARKMKHFLNNFAVKRAIAKARHEQGFMPIDVDKNLAGFAKAVLMEDLYPDVFARMVEHPEAYDALELAALTGGGKVELKRLGLEGALEKYDGLRQILQRTRTTKIEHIEVFLSLKTTNPEARIQRGFELKNAIVEGDVQTIEEISAGIQTDEAKDNLASLLVNLLNERATFLNNAISATLRLYSKENAFTESGRRKIANSASYALLYNEDQKALSQPATVALTCAKDADGNFLEQLIEKYESEIEKSDLPPDDMVESAEALYAYSTDRSYLSGLLNRRFEVWVNVAKGLPLLAELRIPADLKEDDTVPSLIVLGKVAAGLTPESSEAALNANRLRREILVGRWHEDMAPIVGDRLTAMLSQSASEPANSPRNEFVIQFIVERPECLEVRTCASLWPHVRQLFTRASSVEEKLAVHRAVLVFAMCKSVPDIAQSAKTFALENWQAFGDDQIRAVLEFLKTRDMMELCVSLAQQELTRATNEIQNPTERAKQRIALCYENKTLLASSAIEDLFLKAVAAQDSAFAQWGPLIAEYSGKLGHEFAGQVAERCLKEVLGSYNAPRKAALFSLFENVLATVSSESAASLLQTYFPLCKHTDVNVRNAASSVLGGIRKLVNEHDFKLRLNTLVRDLCDMPPRDILLHRPILDSSIEHSVLFEEVAWRDLGALSKRLMQESDGSLQSYGLQLVSKMPKLPSEHEDDLVHLLVTVARTAGAAEKELAAKKLRELRDSGLGEKARSEAEQFADPSDKGES